MDYHILSKKQTLESTSTEFLEQSAPAMSGKGCQLLVSPCSVSPSPSMIRGHQPQSVRIPMSSPQRASLSTSSGVEKVKRGGAHSFVLPSLSLRRQVLTNGKQQNMPTPSVHHPPTTAVTPTAQTGFCSSNSFSKGKNKSPK